MLGLGQSALGAMTSAGGGGGDREENEDPSSPASLCISEWTKLVSLVRLGNSLENSMTFV